jgi:hypothetical protein
MPVTDSLAWWKDNSDKYSRLSVLARRYLAVLSTSVPSERIFSAAGLIVAFSQPYLSKFNSNTLVIVQYFKFELYSYQFNHFVWLTLLNLQASVCRKESSRLQVWLLRSFATDCHRLASTKLFSLAKTLYHNNRITIMNVTWHNLVCK